jgi:hypothetical protein
MARNNDDLLVLVNDLESDQVERKEALSLAIFMIVERWVSGRGEV